MDAPYVYAYVWNHGAGGDVVAGRRLRVQGQVYDMGWRIEPTGVAFEGDHRERLGELGRCLIRSR